MFRKEGNGMEAESGIKAQHTVLVVADDRRVLLLAQAVLARKGHRVLLASNSQLAYPYCRPLGEPAPGEGRRASRPQTVSGPAVLYTSSAQENFRLARFYRRSSAFIGGPYGVSHSRWTGKKSTSGRR